jgi:hypothetical protein
LIDKVEIVPSLAPDEYQTAEADIVLSDGTVYSARCDVPKGDIYRNPMSEAEILDKFYRNVEFSGVLSRENADCIVEAVADIDQMGDIGALIELLR